MEANIKHEKEIKKWKDNQKKAKEELKKELEKSDKEWKEVIDMKG